MIEMALLLGLGLVVGAGASFTGLGGGFLIVPILLFMGYTAQKAAGTSFMAILVISISALLAHGKLDHVDYRAGILLGLGGIIGAQFGARFLDDVTTANFRKLFAAVLIALAISLLWKK